MSIVKLWLPKGLDLAPRMAAAGMACRTVYAEWWVSEVVRWGMLYKVLTGQFVPLAHSQLTTGIPRNLIAPIRRVLIPKVLETDGTFWFGGGEPGKCLGYRLAHGVDGDPEPVTRSAVWLSGKLAAAEDLRVRREERLVEGSPLYRALREHVRSAWLAESAEAESHPLVDHLTGKRRGWFVVCAQGRVHHPVASCPRTLRRHLRLADPHAPLTLIDIASSQPLFLGLEIARSNTNQPQHHPPPTTRDTRLYAPNSDIGRYVNECLHGDLYTRVADVMTGLSVRQEYVRDDAKKGWMAAIYGDAWLMDKQLAGNAVRVLYPDFFHRVQAMAVSLPRGGLARRMQRLESDVVIRGVAAALVDRHPGVPFVTIHDAVLCHTAAAPLVRAVFEEVFETRLGVVPRLDAKPLSG